MKKLLILMLFVSSLQGQSLLFNGKRSANTLNAVITNLTLPNLAITNLLRVNAQGALTNAAIGANLNFDGVTLSATSGGGTSVLINDASVANPDFKDGTTLKFVVTASTNVAAYSTNLTNAQVANSAAIDLSKLATVPLVPTDLAGVVINSGTPADNEIIRYNGTTGTNAQPSGITIDDSKNLGPVNTMTVTNIVVGSGGVVFGGTGALNVDGTAGGIKLNPGSNRTTNSGTMLITGDLKTGSTITDSTGSTGTSGQVPVSAGASAWAWGSSGGGYTLPLGFVSSNPNGNTTYYAATDSVALGVNEGRYTVIVPKAGTLRGWTFHVFGAAGNAGQPLSTSILINNTTSVGADSFDWINFPIRRSGQAATLSTALAVGDYLEIQVVTPAVLTVPPVSCTGLVTLYISTP